MWIQWAAELLQHMVHYTQKCTESLVKEHVNFLFTHLILKWNEWNLTIPSPLIIGEDRMDEICCRLVASISTISKMLVSLVDNNSDMESNTASKKADSVSQTLH